MATPGMRTALNLPDAAAQTNAERRGSGVQRGDVVTLAELGSASSTADVMLERSSRPIDPRSGTVPPLKGDKQVRIHHGSGNFPARLIMKNAELKPGERALAQLQFDAPVFVFAGDRFIVRDWSEQRTLAGGLILDPEADRRKFRGAGQQTFLLARAEDVSANGFIRAQLVRDGAVPRQDLLVKSRFSAAEISHAATMLEQDGVAAFAGDFLVEAKWWQALVRTAEGAVEEWHRLHPEQLGVPLTDLRAKMERDCGTEGIFDALLHALLDCGFAQAGSAVRRATHRPALPAQLRAAGDKIRAVLVAKPFEPPARKDLATDSATHQALRFLIQTGEAVEVGLELVLLADTLEQVRAAVRAHLRTQKSATVSELRQALNTNRRVIVPMLEYLDRIGVTQRQGDQRVLRQPK
ncbi:MAG: SelB C-terminal domain-containing protein, partial [Chthoniobacteraceae bacterium]